jgi:uncharacterized membrane protein YraQ (UPF0718 family)
MSIQSRERVASRQIGVPTIVGLTVGVVGIIALFVIRAVTPELGLPALPNATQDLLTLSISVIVESLPFVILGVVLSTVVQFWIPDHWIARIMPRNEWGRRAVVSFLGMFLPVCECGNVPLARGLVLRGFTVSEAMTFLLAAPILNPITIITTHQAFGFDDGILVARLLGGFIIANLIGWVFSKHPDQESLLTPSFASECAMDDPHAHGRGRVGKSVNLFIREMGVIMPALFVGSLIAGLVQVAVPREVLVSLGSNPLWSILAMMLLAFIISVCSNVDAFFILPFASTFMPGSIATFLLFGPIIDIKMLALLRTTFTTSTLLKITLMVALLSGGIGLAVNYVF